MDINAIFDRICEKKGIKSDHALCEFLGVSKTAVSQSRNNGTANLWNLLDKCRDMDFNWLLKGEAAAAPLTVEAALSALVKAGYRVSIEGKE